MKESTTVTPIQSFESTVKDKSSLVIKPNFDTNTLSIESFGNHLKELVEYNDFPIEALPEQLQEIINSTNDSLNYPKAYTASALLHAASTAIGDTCHSKWKWNENACLYMVLVGNPGTLKTHPITFAYEPISKKDRETYKQYKEDFKQYEIDNLNYLKNKKECNVDPPKKPILQKHIISDFTTEALVFSLQNNPRGFCSHNDELAGWINNMNRYNAGSDVQLWLQIWSAQPIVNDRKSSGSIRIDKPFVNVIGTIQPAVIDELAKDNKSKNGFTDRLLLVWPKGLKRQGWNTNELNPEIKANWARIIYRLLSLDFGQDSEGRQISNHLWYTSEADRVLREWQVENIQEDDHHNSESRDGISAKIETYVFRFSLILQLLKWACDDGDKTKIEASTVRDAIKIAKYFKKTAIEVSAYMSSKSPVDRLPDHKQKIYKELGQVFTTEEGLQIAEANKMPERTFKYWLNDKTFFRHLEHGKYQKLFI